MPPAPKAPAGSHGSHPYANGGVLHSADPLLPWIAGSKSKGITKMGLELLHDPWHNKGTAFTLVERDRLGLRGLLPPRVIPFEKQVERLLQEYHEGFRERRMHDPPDEVRKSGVTPEMVRKYGVLSTLHHRNETLYYKILLDNFKQMVPIIYTPTVGWTCQHSAELFRRPRGMYFSAQDQGEMAAMCANWPAQEVDAIVVTDGSRILGLGDLGASGMGISVGKLSCYVVGAGFYPHRVLPVCIDVGTNNEKFLKDPLYLGLQHHRVDGDRYLAIVDEFMAAVTTRWPGVLVQFEDFSYNHAMTLLDRYRKHRLVFNDDIQGTAAMVLAGVYGALRAQGRPVSDITKLRICCVGAGSAGAGVSDQLRRAMIKHGLSEEEAGRNFWMFDVQGLVTAKRANLPPILQKLARPEVELDSLDMMQVMQFAKPTALLGLSGVGQIFSAEVMTQIGKCAEAEGLRPLIFPLSNPTANSETTPQQALDATGGRAIVATGSPFPEASYNGKAIKASQGNNVYIFPGLALGAVLSKTPIITDDMFMAASEALVDAISEERLQNGQCFPDLNNPREISAAVARGVIKAAADAGMAEGPALEALEEGDDVLLEHIKNSMYVPEYVHLYREP